MDKNELFEKIAKEILDVETLEVRMSDSLDYHEVSVMRLKRALNEAYRAGKGEKMIVGETVKNDPNELKKFLGGNDLRHLGNYVFRITVKGKNYRVVADPTDDNKHIKILSFQKF